MTAGVAIHSSECGFLGGADDDVAISNENVLITSRAFV
jgi:hypothetical protein